MDLLIVRHAIAGDPGPNRGPDDDARPLTTEGRERFERAAAGLAQVAARPIRVLSSPLVRAWQTAEILERTAGWPAPERCDELGPGRAPTETARALMPLAPLDLVAVVGHEPDLSALASWFLTGDAALVDGEVKKGGVVRLRFDGIPVASSGVLRWWIPPKILRSIRS